MQSENNITKPTILIVATRRWFPAARLAMAFAAAGCRVEIACPSGHPALLTGSIAARHSLRAFAPMRSLHSAIRKSRPDLLVPADTVAAMYLHRLYQKEPSLRKGPASYIRALLQRSLGDPNNFPALASRARFLAAAQAEGVSILPTQNIPDEPALRRWLALNPLPAVLKADGTSRGEGVSIVCTTKEAVRAWRKLRAPFGLARFARRSGSEHGSLQKIPWIRRRIRTVSIQPFVHGRDSNIAVACWNGELLSAISLDVLRTSHQNGPAVLVELVQNDDMLNVARSLVKRLNLSGLCGLDFITEYTTGRSYLIEINPHATQTCHLPHGIPRDLIVSLVSALAGRPLPLLNQARKYGIIALFPFAWQSGVTKETLSSAFQDVPWEEPQLVEAGFALEKRPSYRKYVRRWRRARTQRPPVEESI
ncbi:MAG: ATP-grasp domain-containing protein [Silvibacterium sp.]